jgi:hypothetical protein
MKKTTIPSRSFSLIAAILLSGTLLSATLPAQTARAELTQPQLVARSQSLEGVTLTLDDLPPGFTEIPPAIREQLTAQFQTLGQQFGPKDLNLDNFFIFVNPVNFQVVMGFAGELPSSSEQEQFDANLKQMQNPETQQQMLAAIQEKLGALAGVEVTNYTSLPELSDLADASTGMALEMKMQGQSFRVDMASFRRSSVGAFTAVLYPQSGTPFAVRTLADKLDRRILDRS